MGEILPATTFNLPHSTGTFFSLSGGTWHFSLFQPFWNFLGFHNSTLPDFQLFSHRGVQVFWALAARAPCLMPSNKHQHFLSPQPSVRRLVRGIPVWFGNKRTQKQRAFLVVLVVEDLLGNAGDARDWILAFNPWVRKIPLSRKMETHSSILAWKIPWMEEAGGLQSVGLQRVRHDFHYLSSSISRHQLF